MQSHLIIHAALGEKKYVGNFLLDKQEIEIAQANQILEYLLSKKKLDG